MSNGFDTIFYILLIVGGLFGVSDYFAGKSEKMKGFVEKIIPAQGVIGMIITVLAVIQLILSFRYIGDSFMLWLTTLYIILLAFLLGVVLSYKLIEKLFLSKKEGIQEKTDKIVGKVQMWQTPLGWVNFSNGILMMLFMASINGLIKSMFSAAMGG
jgi:hypothetical protein